MSNQVFRNVIIKYRKVCLSVSRTELSMLESAVNLYRWDQNDEKEEFIHKLLIIGSM